MNFQGFLKLSLAHHPLCWQYRNHLIKIRSLAFCLGCSGFYSGFTLGLALILLGVLNSFLWLELVFVSSVFYLPTILRLLKTPGFISSKKKYRFVMRFLLGVGIGTGLFSIAIAPNIFIQIIQILMGLGLYTGISVVRIRDTQAWKECETCAHVRNRKCFGFRSFYEEDDKDLVYTIQDIPISEKNQVEY
ncbi:MAG: hypothetical protein ACW98D_21015 [Promethearchaeota archaeon]